MKENGSKASSTDMAVIAGLTKHTTQVFLSKG